MAPDAEHELDEAAKKHALRLVPYGLYLVGARGGPDTDLDHGGAYAFLGSWVAQCSFDPPLVTVAVRKDSHGHSLIQESGTLSVNPLGEDQLDLARRFIKNVDVSADEMEGTPWEPGDATGAPIFTDLPASLELRVEETVDAGGDHTVLVCRVVGATHRDDRPILTHRDAGMTYAG